MVEYKEYLGRYIVGDDGSMFRRTKHGVCVKKAFLTHRGYLRHDLAGERREYMHRIVAKLFVKKEDGKDQVDHINGNKLDNRAKNLRWCTNKENTEYYLSTADVRPTWSAKEVIGTSVESGDEILFDSIYKASKVTGAPDGGIRRCIRGETKTSAGYYWRPAPSQLLTKHTIHGTVYL